MRKVIWSCWFQGRSCAPPLVATCLRSWEVRNPGWELRCLDEASVRRYIDLPPLTGKRITHASLSDLVRILLLKEFGGVWVDATLLCNRPLDAWLPPLFGQGFFAFDKPAPGRPLASWFLAAEEHDTIVDRWCSRALAYWARRERAHDYFWFHSLFRELCESEPDFRERWNAVPKVSADGPHAVQRLGTYRPYTGEAAARLDSNTPVFKLTHRIDEARCSPGTLVRAVLDSVPGDRVATDGVAPERPAIAPAPQLAALKVATQNLGDHIQILSGLRLLARLGLKPSAFVDRDDDIATAGALPADGRRYAMLLNGWFKTNRREWPPSERIDPVFCGFHIRLFQCPELLSEEALRYYRRHGPIGCRDAHTRELLASRGVDCFESNCLSLSLPRRTAAEVMGDKVFAASRDRRLLDILPSKLGPCTYVNHYSDTTDFATNMERAQALLEAYRREARLIVTTFLHCALPAIAMGIPVVVFYPENDAKGRQSDRERFTALSRLVPVFRFDEAAQVNWNPAPVAAADVRLAMLDALYALTARWSPPPLPPLGPIAPASELPHSQAASATLPANR